MEKQTQPSPEDVAEAFVKQYYVILDKSPENLHRFYQESSLLGWPGVDGVVTPVTTLTGVNEKVMSSHYKNCCLEVKTTDAQVSLEGGVVVVVTGCLTRKDNVKNNFIQTFVLAKQENGFFVLNDILRFFDACNLTTNAAGSSDDKKDQPSPTPTRNSTRVGPSSLNFKAAVQNEKIEELSENNLANGATSTPSAPSRETVPPAEDAKTSLVAPVSNGKVSKVVKPATNVKKVPSVVPPALNVPLKITYASMLAKEIPAASPKTPAVASNAGNPRTIPSSTHGDDLPKISSPNGGSPSSSKVMSMSPRGGQGATSTNEAKGIYIGGLPYDITKQGIADVVKQFGRVERYSDRIQIKRHEDGFCCGFVEFESAESARRAVEAHHAVFGDKEAYIMSKRQPYNRGNNGRARSAIRGEERNGSENDDRTYYSRGRGSDHQRSNSRDQWRSHALITMPR